MNITYIHKLNKTQTFMKKSFCPLNKNIRNLSDARILCIKKNLKETFKCVRCLSQHYYKDCNRKHDYEQLFMRLVIAVTIKYTPN